MKRCWLLVLTVLLVVPTTGLVGSVEAAPRQSQPSGDLISSRGGYHPWEQIFSPNGDGLADRYKALFRLTADADVRAVVIAERDEGNVRIRGPVALGKQAAGNRSWVWDGKDRDGVVQPEGKYWIRFFASTPTMDDHATNISYIDTRVDGAMRVSRSTVYPRATGVHDQITLWYDPSSPGNTRHDSRLFARRLTITAPGGEVVRDSPLDIDLGDYAEEIPDIGATWDGRDSSGDALAVGDYVARLKITDRARNTRIYSRTIRVSDQQLEQRTFRRTVRAADAGNPRDLPNFCYCGPVHCGACIFNDSVPSKRFVGGLSLVSEEQVGVRFATPRAPTDRLRISFYAGPRVEGGRAGAHAETYSPNPGLGIDIQGRDDRWYSFGWRTIGDDAYAYRYLLGGVNEAFFGFYAKEDDPRADVARYRVEYQTWVPAAS